MLWQPGKIEKLAIMLYGTPGCGKSLVVQLMTCLLSQYGPSTFARVSQTKNPGWVRSRFSNAYYRDQCLLMHVIEAKISDDQLHDMFMGMVDEEEMTCEPKDQGTYTATNMCRFIFTGNSENILPVQSTDRKFVVLRATNRYTEDDSASQAVWNRIWEDERWFEHRGIMKAIADHMLEHGKNVKELVRTAPKTEVMSTQQAKNASTDEMFIAWLAQQRLLEGFNSEDLSCKQVVDFTEEFKKANPTDTREKWAKNLTAQKMASGLQHLKSL